MKTPAFLVFLLSSALSFGQTSITPLDCVAPFYHGVASGDPLPDRVIIWTRVTPDDFATPVPVSWRMATDTAMSNIVAQGSQLTNANVDYTVKVDVQGLQPDTYYFYEFSALGYNSARGRTKTAPVGDIDSLRFAVVSCANLEAGYFNAYEVIAQRNDVEAVLMLGDYIYEYEEGGYAQNTNIDRIFDPTNEILTLEDYRLRYSVYHMDHSLQKLHQNFPWICVWDDHESANDSYMYGAENHNPGEGDWADRKLAAQRAYFEWLPIRPKSGGGYQIFRTFPYGDLMDLFMVDTRLEGRDEQGVNVNDPNRSMLGDEQRQWLDDEVLNSNAQYKVLGNQVIFSPITVFGIPINGDAWDGYPAERQNFLNFLSLYSIQNFTVLTGDVHTSWAFNIKNGSNAVGVEFVTPSITSPGAPINAGGILTVENPHIKYVELTQHGFVILDVNTQRIQADWYYINTIDNVDAGYSWATSMYSNSGAMQLQETTSTSLPSDRYGKMMAPQCPRTVIDNTGVKEISAVDVIGVYPNPAHDQLFVHFADVNGGTVQLIITDLNGKKVFESEAQSNAMNSTITVLNVSDLVSGLYLLHITDAQGNKVSSRFIRE